MTEESDNTKPVAEETWQALIEAATLVRQNAHVPYSSFPVGAALLTEAGDIITGCNVEIASIGATVCAERTAIGCAVAQGQQDILALCVITDTSPPAAPCGICRQVLAEFSDNLLILLTNPQGERRFTTLNELLPMRFSGRDFTDQ